MPGVPSGRGCDGCRIQKKKCDQAKPSCSRCTRLKMTCVGAGQQRYKFKEEHGARNSIAIPHRTKGFSGYKVMDAVQTVPHTPSSELTLVTNAFVGTMAMSTPVRFNLVYWYGEFLRDIPARLGRNEALDSSVKALTAAHSSFCLHHRATPEALVRYSVALRTLRFYLNDPTKACSSETLCAVMLLLICQGFIGVTDMGWTGHCEGAAHIIKARRYYDPSDEFESKLLLSLRAPVILEGIFNPKIQFTPSEWKTLVENHIDEGTFPGRMLRYVSHLASMIQHGNLRKGVNSDTESVNELRSNYQELKDGLKKYEDHLNSLVPIDKELRKLAFDSQTYYLIERFYSFGLTVGIILGCVISAFDTEDTDLVSDLNLFSSQIMALAGSAKMFKPLGTSFMQLCFQAAWVGTTDPSVKAHAEKEMIDYLEEYTTGFTPTRYMRELERMSKHLRLVDPYVM